MSVIVAEDWVPVKIERVFAFFSDPGNLPRLMPPQMEAKIEDMRLKAPESDPVVGSGGISSAKRVQVAGVGSEIEISFRLVPLLPFRGRWVAEIVRYEPGARFQDIQKRGPMKSWRHTHEFERQVRDGVEGTLVRDVVDYELPFGVLGRLADWAVVGWMMRGTFQSRQKALLPLLQK